MNYDFNSRVSVRNAMIKSFQLNTDVFISFVVSRVHTRRILTAYDSCHGVIHKSIPPLARWTARHPLLWLFRLPCSCLPFFSSSAVVISLLSGFPLCVTHVIKSPSKPHTSPQCQRIANTAYQSCDQSHQACPSHKGWTAGRGIHINHTWQG